MALFLLETERWSGDEGKAGCVAGNAGADGAEDPGCAGAAAWIRHRAADRADQRRPAGGESGDALPAAAEAGTRRLDCFAVGRVGQQSPGPVLSHYRSGPQATGDGNE